MSISITKSRLSTLSLLASALGLCLAVVFALGPADRAASEIVVTSNGPESGHEAVTPLVLTDPHPRSISLRFPCAAAFNLSTSASSTGLEVRQESGVLTIISSGSHVGSWATPDHCVVAFQLTDESYSLHIDDRLVTGSTERPEVTLIKLIASSEVHRQSHIEIVTEPFATTPSARQLSVGALCLLAVALAIWLGRSWVRRYRDDPHLRVPSVDIVDIVVLVALSLWAIVGPPLFDDGWATARLDAHEDVGGFSVYYTLAGVETPLGNWFGWLQLAFHRVLESPIAMRLPVIAILLAGWFVVRVTLANTDEPAGRLRTLAAAGLFIVGSSAWGMTLRPEPLVAFLAGVALLLAIKLKRSPRLRTLFWMGLLAALAITVHPTGIVVLAPLIVVSPTAARHIQKQDEHSKRVGNGSYLTASVAIALITVTIGTLLFFADSDLMAKADIISDYAAVGDHDAWIAGEFERYGLLSEAPYSVPVRRTFVLLGVLTVILFVSNWLTQRSPHTRLIGMSAVAGLVLLSATPSKWPWHFGSLLVIFAVAFAHELPRSKDNLLMPTGILGFLGVASAAIVGWRGGGNFNLGDLRSASWKVGGSSVIPIDMSEPLVWVVLASLAGLISVARQKPGAATSYLAIASCFLAFGTTSYTLVVDSIETAGWTFAKQNLMDLTGRENCGLGDEILAPEPGSLQRLPLVGGPRVAPSEVRAGDSYGYPQSLVTEALSGGVTTHSEAPWFRLEDRSDSLVVPIAGDFSDVIVNIEGRENGTGMRAQLTSPMAVSSSLQNWTLVTIPSADIRSDQIRVVTTGESSSAIVGPIYTASSAPLSEVDWEQSGGILVHPALRLLVPCGQQPSIRDGVARPPGVVVGGWEHMESFEPARESVDYALVQTQPDQPPIMIRADSLFGTQDGSDFTIQLKSKPGESRER